ncbi:MAG: hypothetical protein CFE21_07415 [Bacteroidetes bacterium B1(2017)]|nr:MAG: hypothetical protein CFE21_07415 [Bacteroidetes bacterium B1(2017)]
MENQETSRKNFIKLLTKSLGGAIADNPILNTLIGNEDVLRLNEVQQEFMVKYGIWMDENIHVIKQIKAEPNNMEWRKKMMALSEEAADMQETLTDFMKDRTFGLIYHASIQKMRAEIGD